VIHLLHSLTSNLIYRRATQRIAHRSTYYNSHSEASDRHGGSYSELALASAVSVRRFRVAAIRRRPIRCHWHSAIHAAPSFCLWSNQRSAGYSLLYSGLVLRCPRSCILAFDSSVKHGFVILTSAIACVICTGWSKNQINRYYCSQLSTILSDFGILLPLDLAVSLWWSDYYWRYDHTSKRRYTPRKKG